MAQVHQLILDYGIEEARRQAVTKHERQVVEAAYHVLTEEADRIGFAYSGFALTALPHKPQADTVWRREGHNITLVVQSGVDRGGAPLGLPYGSYARFILLFLQSEAIRTSSREVELGASMYRWIGNMGLSIGGKTYRLVNEQARRISGCTLNFFGSSGDKELMRRGGFVDGGISMTEVSPDGVQLGLWQEKVVLNEEFYQALRAHPVPLSESALRAIGPRSVVIDIYIWLAYRLHALKTDAEVSWPALHAQFGAGHRSRLRSFREHWIECLKMALAAYPDARVSIGPRGVTLRPSRPAVPRL